MWTTGDRVLAHRPPGEFWYPGVIRHIQDDRFFVIYDDGEDALVKAKQMMPLALDVGDVVFALPPESGDYQPARIIDKRDDRFHLEYQDGTLAWATTARVRVQPAALKTWTGPAPRPAPAPARWAVGDRVFACWFDLFWYSGTVLDVADDRVSVVFDHGGHALLPADRVHPLELAEGEVVQGRWKAGPDFYPGKLARRDGEVVEVDYDDGDHERTLVRLLRLERDGWLPGPGPTDLGSGDRVLGCWFDGFWYPGIILAVEGKRVHVLFDDNDQAYLAWDKVRPLEVEVGDRVFCRWKGGPFYHPGQITRRHGERILVRYDDGREEWTSVRLVRLDHGEPGRAD